MWSREALVKLMSVGMGKLRSAMSKDRLGLVDKDGGRDKEREKLGEKEMRKGKEKPDRECVVM